MYLKSAAAFAVAVLSFAAAAQAADAPADVAKSITANYALNCTMALNPTDANFDVAAATLAPTFSETSLKGTTQTREEVIAQGKQQLKIMHVTTCENNVVSMTQSDPNTVVAVVSAHMEGDMQAPDGKHDFDYTGKSQDTWTLTGGKWLESGSKQQRVLVKVDGNVVQDQGQ